MEIEGFKTYWMEKDELLTFQRKKVVSKVRSLKRTRSVLYLQLLQQQQLPQEVDLQMHQLTQRIKPNK